MAKARSDEQESDSRQCRWDEPPKDGEVLHPSKADAVDPAGVRGKLSDLTREVWRVSASRLEAASRLTGSQETVTPRQKSAEGVIVVKSRSA